MGNVADTSVSVYLQEAVSGISLWQLKVSVLRARMKQNPIDKIFYRMYIIRTKSKRSRKPNETKRHRNPTREN